MRLDAGTRLADPRREDVDLFELRFPAKFAYYVVCSPAAAEQPRIGKVDMVVMSA